MLQELSSSLSVSDEFYAAPSLKWVSDRINKMQDIVSAGSFNESGLLAEFYELASIDEELDRFNDRNLIDLVRRIHELAHEVTEVIADS